MRAGLGGAAAQPDLTDGNPPNDPTGSVQLRGVPVRVLAEEPTWASPGRGDSVEAEAEQAA